MTGLDMTASIAPRSDQINFDDVATADMTVTIVEAKPGSAEQPIDFDLAETPGRCYRPSKSMRRVMVAAWGRDAATYAGRRLTLYGDPTVKFGSATVGGIKIRAMSHLDKPMTVQLTATRGKRAPHTVQPLPGGPASTAAPSYLDALRKAMADAGITAKDDALAYLSKVAGRTVAASKELTEREAADVVAALTAATDPPAGWDDAQVREVAP